MSYAPEHYENDFFAADAALDERVAFIRKTYMHLFGAILLFAALCALFVTTPAIYVPLLKLASMSWLLILGAFMLASWAAQAMAHSQTSPAVQYAGLALYAVAEAAIFTPLLWFTTAGGQNFDIVYQAGALTLIITAGLTAVVVFTKKDFSFMRGALAIGMFAAFGLIVVATLLPGTITLGTWFVVAMIVLMSGYILYETSNVLHHYHTSQYVAASLALFAAVATLFFYVLQLLSILGND